MKEFDEVGSLAHGLEVKYANAARSGLEDEVEEGKTEGGVAVRGGDCCKSNLLEISGQQTILVNGSSSRMKLPFTTLVLWYQYTNRRSFYHSSVKK